MGAPLIPINLGTEEPKPGDIAITMVHRVSQKKNTAGSTVQMPVASTPFDPEIVFGSFLTKTKLDQVPPSHAHGKIWPQSTQFWLGFFLFSVFGTPCIFGLAA